MSEQIGATKTLCKTMDGRCCQYLIPVFPMSDLWECAKGYLRGRPRATVQQSLSKPAACRREHGARKGGDAT